MKTLTEYNKKSFGEIIGYNLKSAWYFERWYEKLMLICLGALGMWKIWGFF